MADPFHSALLLLPKIAEVRGGPQNNKMHRTSHGQNGGSPLTLVFYGRRGLDEVPAV